MPLSEAEFTLTSIVEDLHRDLHPIAPDNRPARATGTAISTALSLLEVISIFISHPSHFLIR